MPNRARECLGENSVYFPIYPLRVRRRSERGRNSPPAQACRPMRCQEKRNRRLASNSQINPETPIFMLPAPLRMVTPLETVGRRPNRRKITTSASPHAPNGCPARGVPATARVMSHGHPQAATTIALVTRLFPWARNSPTSRQRMPRPCGSQRRTRATQIPHDLTKIPAQIGPAQTGRNPLSFASQPKSMM